MDSSNVDQARERSFNDNNNYYYHHTDEFAYSPSSHTHTHTLAKLLLTGQLDSAKSFYLLDLFVNEQTFLVGRLPIGILIRE